MAFLAGAGLALPPQAAAENLRAYQSPSSKLPLRRCFYPADCYNEHFGEMAAAQHNHIAGALQRE